MIKNKPVFAWLALVFLSVFGLHSENTPDGEKVNWGFIFNTSSILLDIESYQYGLGAKALFPNNMALRFLVNGSYSSEVDTFDASLGIALEKHFRPGRISPYGGGFVRGGLTRYYNETDEDNWTKDISIPFSAGAILGVEFFIVESISLFAEYNIVFEGAVLTESVSVAGTVTEMDPEFSYKFDTGIGNEAKLGIVIYLDDIVAIEKK
ncbi:MAG: hypothetical protein JXR86_04695 [Spirochaetales bacterium]|nr:hypothetical protein [Spirochaetales bacterium]